MLRAERFILYPGWNFVSFLKQPPPGTPINVIVEDISPSVGIIWGFDNETKVWKKYRPGTTSSTLAAIEPNKGYWFYMNQLAAMNLTQWTGPSATVPLRRGWNLVGYPGPDDQSLASALGNISDAYSLIWNWTGGCW
jgi:hypothetical protein